VWQNQPAFISRAYPAEYAYCHLRFFRPGETGSLPYSAGLFIDEAAFQPELEAALGAAQPVLKGGGRLDIVSSAEPGYFGHEHADDLFR
jgi:hypothetical protein